MCLFAGWSLWVRLQGLWSQGRRKTKLEEAHALSSSIFTAGTLNPYFVSITNYLNCFAVQPMPLVWIHDPMERQLEASREATWVARRLVAGCLPSLPFLLQVSHSPGSSLVSGKIHFQTRPLGAKGKAKMRAAVKPGTKYDFSSLNQNKTGERGGDPRDVCQ